MNGWITGNRFLSQAEMEHNALLVNQNLYNAGFSLNAISAIIANMEAESTINPGIWEGLVPYSGGYGLVQWTPYYKYSDWAGMYWENNGDAQCKRIAYEFDNGLQYYPTNAYAILASTFKKSNDEPEYLAGAWMYNYERPASYSSLLYRQERARYWYNYLKDDTPQVPEPTPTPERKGGKRWLLLHQG